MEVEDFKTLEVLLHKGFKYAPKNDWRAKSISSEVSSEPVFRICSDIAKIGGYPMTCDIIKAADFQKADGTCRWYLLLGLNTEYTLAEGSTIEEVIQDFCENSDDFTSWVDYISDQLGLTAKQCETAKAKTLELKDRLTDIISGMGTSYSGAESGGDESKIY